MEKYIKIEENWYGALKGDILKWTGNKTYQKNHELEFPKSRKSTSSLHPYASDQGLKYIPATEEEWNKQEGINQSLTPSTLIINGIYVIEYEGAASKYNSIFVCGGKNGELKTRLWLYEPNFEPLCSGRWSEDNNPKYRRAASEEVKWIEKCIQANEFIPKEEALKPNNHPDLIKKESVSLEGRWFKALVDEPQSTQLKKGDFIQAKNERSFYPWGDCYYGYSISEIGKSWEVMPEGFSPTATNETSKTNLDMIPEYWAIKADGRNGIASNYFNKQYGGTCYTGFNSGFLHRFNLSDQDIQTGGNLDATFHHDDLRPGYTEITLEQFQKYILKDRLVSNVKGETWCVKCTEENKEVIRKWLKDNSSSLAVGNTLHYGLKEGVIAYGSYEGYSPIISTEEFYQKIGYFPTEKEWIPKVGDWVITYNYSNKYDGKALKITKIRTDEVNTYYWFEPNDYSSANFSKDMILRKAFDHEIPKTMETTSSPLTFLPEKWCIRFASQKINTAVNKHFGKNLFWEDSEFYTCYYWTSHGQYTMNVTGFVEITFEQFKKWVLKEESKSDGKMNEKEALEYAKKHYPLYTNYKPLDPDGNRSISDIEEVSRSSPRNLGTFEDPLIDLGIGYVYACGKWAEIVQKPIEASKLLIEAEKRYPIGTKVRCLKGENGRAGIDTISEKLKIYTNGDISHIRLCGYVYSKGEWAEIISEEKKVETSNYEYIVVHCKTQEEWDFIIENQKKNSKPCVIDKSTWKIYKDQSCFNILDGCYSGLDFFKRQKNSLISSFSEWCEREGYLDTNSISVSHNPCAEILLWDSEPSQKWVNVKKVETKKKGFDEKEWASNPYNQKLPVHIKKVNKTKIKLNY